jgi:hypothetical protein
MKIGSEMDLEKFQVFLKLLEEYVIVIRLTGEVWHEKITFFSTCKHFNVGVQTGG